ncbi:MAG: hypothetical protein V3W41_08275 [Planctomycetota bacterium]
MGALQKKGSNTTQFGDLPPKLRDKILQARKRGFPKGYEKILESYYKRLANKAKEARESKKTKAN